MKNLKKIAFLAITAITLTACNTNDDTLTNPNTTNEAKVDAYLQFENVFEDQLFALNKDYETTNNGVLNITTLKYIVTDITLHGADGTDDYSASTQESFHIVDQSCEASKFKYLTKVPNGKYTKVTLRYGVSEAVHEQGAAAQGAMLLAAQDAGLFWGWTTGYRFMTYEGTYNNGAGTFKVHNGSHGSSTEGHGHGDHSHGAEKVTKINNDVAPTRIDNSKEIVLDFSDEGEILVSDQTSPKIHLKIDVAQILDNTSNDENDLDVSKGDIIIDTHKSPKVAENVSKMFAIAHIHPTDVNFDIPNIETCTGTNPNDTAHDTTDGHHDTDKEEAAHDHSDGHHGEEKEESHDTTDGHHATEKEETGHDRSDGHHDTEEAHATTSSEEA